MRLIDADALDFDVMGLTIVSPEVMNYANAVIAAIAKAPTIEAEPVRHGDSTSFITTSDIDTYKSRIIVEESKSKFCRVFYEDDREHGRWEMKGSKEEFVVYECTVCESQLLVKWYDKLSFYRYCPNCGAKMDLEE